MTSTHRASELQTEVQKCRTLLKKPFSIHFHFLVMGKDKTQDENAATSSDARDREQESRDTVLARAIAQAVAEAFTKQKADETKIVTETFTRQMEKVSGLWIHSTGLMTKTFTRDGNYGL